MDNELIPLKDSPLIPSGHEEMLRIYERNYPLIQADTRNFGKRQSAFMDNMLTVTQLTPMRRARQILAELERAGEALRQTWFRQRKAQVKIKKLQRKLDQTDDLLEQEELQIKLERARSDLEHGKLYVSGAIRKTVQLMEQYNSILEKAGVEEFSEEAFEREEEEYHIKTAFCQALSAARSHGGVIDEGNHIYLFQVGINGAAAQADVALQLAREGKMLKEGQVPTHDMVLKFLDQMAEKYRGCSTVFAEAKGMEGTYRPSALLKETRILIEKVAS